ncbi:MAG TPA: response regulator transcription factor, partial [Parvularculaceae bacterium]|nr:response regulator transcription factor [Parvularculaceae bacterium]
TESPPDLMIIDRMLPRLDGVSMLKAARAAGVNAPALFLTALGTVDDRVEGIDAGGDDYLVKPFAFAELRARIHALLRRAPLREEKAELVIGDLTLDRLGRRVMRGGDEIKLQAREFQLLEFLMLNEGRVVTRTMLLEEIWGFRFDPGTNIVETHISRLRSKIGDGAAMITTKRGAGYVLSAK